MWQRSYEVIRTLARAARAVECEAHREAEVAAFDKACSDAAARAPHDHAEASAARDDQAAVKTAQAREDYNSQAREDYKSVSAAHKGDVLLQQPPQVRDKYQYFLPESLEMRACACCGELTFLNERRWWQSTTHGLQC